MKILHTESSMHWGGQEFRTLLEHNYLNEHQHESWLICHPESQLYQKAVTTGAKNIIAMNLSKAWRLDIALRLLLICKLKRINVINSHSAKDSLLCLLAYLFGTPLVRSRQITNSIRKKFSYSHCCSHILAAADIIKSMLINAGVDQKKITVIGEGVDLQEFNPNVDSDYLKKEFNIQPNDKVIINIGMIRADKGQKYFLDAAIKILKLRTDVKFFLIGEATEASKPFERELIESISQHKIADHFVMTGYRNDVAAFIHLSDLVVVASIGTEAQSRIVPQSFATSRTVVTTNAGGLTELVSHEANGLVVPPSNAEAMSEAIIRLLDNQALKHKLESAAYTMAINQLSFEQMMTKTITLYTQLTSPHC
ncbi:alpha-D-kanosaminyltransferase [mine drainage metagenome]|uniref:Alpha-D-kanosaminyltransferase n=1 Tax=mine drainage metagenome TaxID=410659 RepID=A0A1J5S4B3_9ZZZZ